MTGDASGRALPFETPSEPFVTAHRSVGRLPVHLFRIDQPPGDYSESPQPEIVLSRVDQEFHGHVDHGAGTLGPTFRRGELAVAAPGANQRIVMDGRSCVSVILLPVEPLAEALADGAPGFDGDFGALHARTFRNPRVDRLMDAMWRETAADHPYGALFAENAAQTLAIELLCEAHACTVAPPGTRALPPPALARVEDYLDANLGDDVSLADLAALVGLSPYHFSRAFKAATGLPPHRYLIERRVARARERLEHGGDPIVDVALECGFSSQAHMTSTFTRQLGVSPGRYRKEKRR